MNRMLNDKYYILFLLFKKYHPISYYFPFTHLHRHKGCLCGEVILFLSFFSMSTILKEHNSQTWKYLNACLFLSDFLTLKYSLIKPTMEKLQQKWNI